MVLEATHLFPFLSKPAQLFFRKTTHASSSNGKTCQGPHTKAKINVSIPFETNMSEVCNISPSCIGGPIQSEQRKGHFGNLPQLLHVHHSLLAPNTKSSPERGGAEGTCALGLREHQVGCPVQNGALAKVWACVMGYKWLRYGAQRGPRFFHGDPRHNVSTPRTPHLPKHIP